MQKYIKEVFKDYNIENNIFNAQIENINLYKKTNKLQVELISDSQIGIKEIESFENYLIERFKVNKAILDIKYSSTAEINCDISKQWNDIISYITKKEPFTRAMLNR